MGAGAGWVCSRVSFLGRSVRKLSEVEEPRKKEKKGNPIAWSPGDLRYNEVRPQMLIETELNPTPPTLSSDFSQGFPSAGLLGMRVILLSALSAAKSFDELKNRAISSGFQELLSAGPQLGRGRTVLEPLDTHSQVSPEPVLSTCPAGVSAGCLFSPKGGYPQPLPKRHSQRSAHSDGPQRGEETGKHDLWSTNKQQNKQSMGSDPHTNPLLESADEECKTL